MTQKTKRFILIGILLSFLTFPSMALAGQINVLTTNENASGIYLPADYFNFATGYGYTVVRNDLLNPTNFGSGGIVAQSVNILPSANVIDAASLANVNVVVLAPWTNITNGERAALVSFVQNGGGLFVAGNYAEYLGSSFGAPVQNNWGTAAPVSVNNMSPIITGPFGTVSGNIGIGACSYFTDVGPNGTVALTDVDGKIIGATFQSGLGHVVIITDEEIFLNATAGQTVLTGYAGQVPNPANETLFLNSFAYVIPASVPEPATILLLGLGLIGLAGVRRKFKS